MSEGSYKRAEDVDEASPGNLGVPEKQAEDLGIHKFVFRGSDPRETVSTGNTDVKPNSVIIVQDKNCAQGKYPDEIDKELKSRLIIASILCLTFILLEFAGAYLSNSLVVAAAATQLFTVFSTIMVVLLAIIRLSAQGDRSSPISLKRPEVILSLVSILITCVLASIVLYLAFDRITKGSFQIDVDMMLATSAFGVVANLVIGMSLHNNYQVKGMRSINMNVRGAFWHFVGDFLFSVAVFSTALFINYYPEWRIIDPIITIKFSIFVLYTTITIMRDIINVIAEGTPKDIYFKELLKTLMAVDGVLQVQDLRLWTVGAEELALSAHITIRSNVKSNDVLLAVSRSVHDQFNFCEVTLHLEVLQENGAALKESAEEKLS